MKKLLYAVCTVLYAAALSGCSKGTPDEPVPQDELAVVELSAVFEPVSVTRATVSQVIRNVAFVIFNEDGTVFDSPYIDDYEGGERIYLRVGKKYQVFAVANLDASNCPGSLTPATFFSDVSSVADLANKYLIGSSTAADKVIMCSDAPVILDIVTGPSYSHPIEIRCVQTRIDFNVYNKCDSSGNPSSGVTLHSYNINNLPSNSWLLERMADYSDASSGFWHTGELTFPSYSVVQASSGEYYRKYSIPVYVFENRQGEGTEEITDENDRKKYAPELATEFVILGEDASGHVFDTYVHPGKGRTPEETPDDDNINNFDVDRNCIYTISVFIKGVDDISIDTRRQYYKVVLCGNLEKPTIGDTGNF